MKNKFKRLQLTVRNYRKKGIIFGSVFALTLLSLSVLIPKLNSHADPNDQNIITSANADVMTPVAGSHPNTFASPSDDTKYSVTVLRWNLEEEPYPVLDASEVFELDKNYTVRVIFTPNEGYTFSEDAIFTINSVVAGSYGSIGERQRTFVSIPPEEEQVFDITYDLNGATVAGESTVIEHSVSVGMELSEENLINQLGVEVPSGKVLNYITVNDEPFNVGDGFFLDRNIVIKYFWRDDTSEMCAVEFDPNGGTPLEYEVPGEVPCGQTFIFNAPDETQVQPPENQEFDAFEINGVRYENGSTFTVNGDSSFKLLWKNLAPPPTFTVEFNDGGILSTADKLVSQTITGGEYASMPTNSAGDDLYEILTEFDGEYYYNDYKLLGFYSDPNFNTPYEGGPVTSNLTIYIQWYDTLLDYEQIPEVNLIVTPPEAGTEITMEGEDRDTQSPELAVTLPEDARYNLWTDSEEENYAYWIKEKQFWSDPFVGVLEKGGKYYAEVWIRTNEPEEVVFARNVVVKVNGVALPAEQISYDIDSIVAIVEIDLSETEDSTAVPNTGIFTLSEGSAVVAVSGGIIALISATGIFYAIKRRKTIKKYF